MSHSEPSESPNWRGRLRKMGTKVLREEGKLTRLVRGQRLLFTLLFFGLLSAVSVTASFLLRFVVLENVLSTSLHNWHLWWLAMLCVTVPVRLVFFWAIGLHRQSWRFASVEDLPPLVMSVLASSSLIIVALWIFWTSPGGFPLSTLAMDMVLCLALVTLGRFAYRLVGGPVDHLGNRAPRRRAIIVGAGNAGNLTIEAMQSPRLGGFKPVAIVDDNPLVKGMRIRGVEVLGGIDDIAAVARRKAAEVVVLAIPSASTSQLYRIVSRCQESDLPLKSVPSFWEIMESDKPSIRRVEDFSTDSLLSRRPVAGDQSVLAGLLAGKRVLVTGAAGSIGSELCRQITECGAAHLACLDKDENGLFRLERELRDAGHDTDFDFLLGDIKNESRLDAFFKRARPDVVFHAAAYKHVPILQFHPEEAVGNNVLGTRRLVEMAVAYRVQRFVMISTDKAVNPTNVMGASKQVAEKVVLSEAISERRGPAVLDHPLRQRPGQRRQRGGDVPPADRPRRAGHGHPSGHGTLLHDHRRGGPAGPVRRGDGHRRRGVHPRHGRPGEDRRPGAADDPPVRADARCRREDRFHRAAAGGEAQGGTLGRAVKSPTGRTMRISWSPAARRSIRRPSRAAWNGWWPPLLWATARRCGLRCSSWFPISRA